MKILYVCTHNRCRSILSEALTNQLGGGMLIAASAGSEPAREVHPLSLKFLTKKRINTQGLKSQSWQELEGFEPDIVITVCDDAAAEVCPVWMKDTRKIHWPLRDPSKITGSSDEVESAFERALDKIEERVLRLKSLIEAEGEKAISDPKILTLAH